MRVLYLVPDFFGPGGIARHGRVLCQALLESGVEVDVLALNDWHGRNTTGSATLLELPGMHYRACHGQRKTFVRQALSLARRHPDLVLVEHVNFSPLGWMVAYLRGAPWVVVAHGVEVWDSLSRVRRWALKQSNQVLCVSHFTARRIVDANNIPAHTTRVLHNCLDPRFQFGVASAHEGRPQLLTVGRTSLVEQYKGHDYVIRALPQLLSRFPDLIYHIIGEGDGRPRLQELAKEQGVDLSIRWSSRVSEEELSRHYAEASLFIMPSSGEGFGLVFVEAMAQGVPVIGGNKDATPEVIRDGETGFLVDPTSVEDIVNKTSRLLKDVDLCKRMGHAAIRHVEQEFNFGKFRHQLLELLSEVHPGFHAEQSASKPPTR